MFSLILVRFKIEEVRRENPQANSKVKNPKQGMGMLMSILSQARAPPSNFFLELTLTTIPRVRG
jgi:hypothetical protein